MEGKINNLQATRVVAPTSPPQPVTQRETNAGIARNGAGGCGQVRSLLIRTSSVWLGRENSAQFSLGEPGVRLFLGAPDILAGKEPGFVGAPRDAGSSPQAWDAAVSGD